MNFNIDQFFRLYMPYIIGFGFLILIGTFLPIIGIPVVIIGILGIGYLVIKYLTEQR